MQRESAARWGGTDTPPYACGTRNRRCPNDVVSLARYNTLRKKFTTSALISTGNATTSTRLSPQPRCGHNASFTAFTTVAVPWSPCSQPPRVKRPSPIFPRARTSAHAPLSAMLRFLRQTRLYAQASEACAEYSSLKRTEYRAALKIQRLHVRMRVIDEIQRSRMEAVRSVPLLRSTPSLRSQTTL